MFQITHLMPEDGESGKAKVLTYSDGKVGKLLTEDKHQFKYQTIEFKDGLSHFADFLTNDLLPGDVIMLTAPKRGFAKEGIIVSDGWRAAANGKVDDVEIISTTKTFFDWPKQSGIWMFDFDDLPNDTTTDQIPDIMAPLFEAAPFLGKCQYVTATSSSSLIFETSTGRMVNGVRGFHAYFVIDTASRSGELAQLIFDRMAINGHGSVKVSENGSALRRGLIDNAIYQPTRLDFAAGAIMGSDEIEQRRHVQLWNPEGNPIVEAKRFMPLTEDERETLSTTWAELIQLAKPEMDRKFEDYVQRQPEQNRESHRAMRNAQGSFGGSGRAKFPLFGDFLINLENGGVVSVSDILDDPQSYHEKRVCDPETGDKGKSRIYANDNSVVIGCFAQSGRNYILKRAPEAKPEKRMTVSEKLAMRKAQNNDNKKSGIDEMKQEEITLDWAHTTKDGIPKVSRQNVGIAIQFINKTRNLGIRFNELANDFEIKNAKGVYDRIADHDITRIGHMIEDIGLLGMGDTMINSELELIGRKNAYHPVRQFLQSLTWDGVSRTESWLTDHCGVEDSIYTRAVSRAFLVGMVARVMKPGVKHDCVLVLAGKQGAGKSTLCRILGGEWYTDQMPSITMSDGREARMHLQGKWIVEIAELAPTRKAENEAVKSFLTSQEDDVRAPYARRSVKVSRQCVFVGTTNEDEYLNDPTGGRRYWPLTVGTIDTEGLTAIREQLLAEALHLYQAGAKWVLEGEALEQATERQAAVTLDDPWVDVLRVKLADDAVAQVNRFDNATLFRLLDQRDMNRATAGRLGKAMVALGWTRTKSNNAPKEWLRPNVIPFTPASASARRRKELSGKLMIN